MIDAALQYYARRRRKALAAEDAVAAQTHQLLQLVARAKDTRFGRDHGFPTIRSVSDFQRAVPLRRYEAMWAEYWKDTFPSLVDISWPGTIPYFAVTSGTTSGTSKFIPVSHAMNRANTRAGFELLVHHLAAWPMSRLLGGKTFMLGGSTALTRQAPGIYSGDLSGIAVKRLPWWLKGFTFPPPEIAAEADFEAKVAKIAAQAPDADIRVLGGTPSWLLLLFERQEAILGRPAKARDLYAHLELLVHGGVNFKPYRKRFEAFLDGMAELREVYPASEGFIALQDKGHEEGLRLVVDNGLFFEFVPVEELESPMPTRHTIADAQLGVNYALVLSSCAGAFAYVIGDTVRFVSKSPPRIMVTGRISYFMSAFGEHLIGEEIEGAVAASAASMGLALNDFSMGADFENACHSYVVEFERKPSTEALGKFIGLIDADLKVRNDDYLAHRSDNSVRAPRALAAAPGTFAAWMKTRGRVGGQNKVPRVINDAELFANLAAFAAKSSPQ